MNQMIKTTGILTQIFFAVMFLVLQTNVFAAGTPAGTVISNYATVNYKSLNGTSFPAVNSNTVTTTVAQVAGVAITPPTGSKTSSDSSYVSYAVTVTNTGNGTDTFNLARVSSRNWSPVLYRDINRNGVLDANEIDSGAVSTTSPLAADSSYYLIARIFVPFNTASNAKDTLSVTATSVFNNSVSANGTYVTTISAAVLTLSKSQSSPNRTPGQTVTYTLTYENTGTGKAVNAGVTDQLSTNITFVNNSIVVPNGQSASYNSTNRTITWTIGTVLGGGTGTMTFDATVNSGVPSGTNISNQGSISYTDSANNVTRTGNSGTTTLNVTTATSFTLAITPQSRTQDVDLSVSYLITLTNTGNATDSFTVALTSSRSFPWTLYVDANNDSILNTGDYLMNLNNAGPTAQNGVFNFLAIDTIPHNTPDQSIDTTMFTVKSRTDTTVTGNVTAYTTARAPQVSLTKTVSVFGVGASIPGATLLYTITFQNNGTGAAATVVVTDTIPANTTYSNGTILYNDATRTDGADGDNAQFINGIITVNVGSLAGSSSGTIKFRVTIN